LALYSEIGVPNIDAIKIYLAGIKSRVTALDLSSVLSDKMKGASKSNLLDFLNEHKIDIELFCSETTLKWVELFNIGLSKEVNKPFVGIVDIVDIVDVVDVVDFTLNEAAKSKVLNVRGINNKLFLCSPDFEDKIEIESTKELPFEKVSNNSKVFFRNNRDVWEMKVRGE
jgi:hypothetical protein